MSGRSQRGSALLLVPAAILVLAVLGGIAVDSAVVFLAQRELGSATAAAANDAAGAAFAESPFYEGGRVELDIDAARRVAAASMRAREPRGLEYIDGPSVRAVGRQLCVEASAQVKRIFAPAIPGVARTVTLHARSSASLVGDNSQRDNTACQ